MKERMQKTLSQVNGCPQRDRSETEWYGGVQTFMWMCEDNIVEVPFGKEHLFEQILSPANLNRAYKAVVRNRGCGGIDKMSCEQLLPWLLTNKDLLIRSLMDGSYRPNPVKRVEIPKVQSQDEVKVERTDKSQQRMGVCQEKAKAERIHKRVGRLLSPCQHEASLA